MKGIIMKFNLSLQVKTNLPPYPCDVSIIYSLHDVLSTVKDPLLINLNLSVSNFRVRRQSFSSTDPGHGEYSADHFLYFIGIDRSSTISAISKNDVLRSLS